MSKGSNVKGKTVLQLARSIAAGHRQAARDARSPHEQLALLVSQRPGESARERAKLTQLIKGAAQETVAQETVAQETVTPRRRSHRGHR